MSSKSKFYVVWKGAETGVFSNWEDCQKQIKGFVGAVYKSFSSEEEAHEAYRAGIKTAFSSQNLKSKNNAHHKIITQSIAVDAACSGNPGPLEYKGVWTENKTVIFHSRLYPLGTVNMGEFLALVHALALCKQQKLHYPIYTDSITALAWVRNKRIKTNLERNSKTEELFVHLDKAIKWLENNTYDNLLLKWQTEIWGEIPADFGRK
ncbi:MAG: ribonuclease H [Cytophagales bacterium]|nr:MAG: ribonuclease H [Cytophagales bacterium]TAF61731.1 MAG: ribonuclease H [Cytophagales bacterium]